LGCIVYVRNTKPHLQKLEHHEHKMIFVGYERGTKVFWVYHPETRCVHVSRDVVFDEEGQWDWSDVAEENMIAAHDDDIFTIEYMIGSTNGTQENILEEEPATPVTPSASIPIGQGGSGAATPSADIQFASPPQNVAEWLDADHDEDAPLRF
jgi:hypothetical protein